MEKMVRLEDDTCGTTEELVTVGNMVTVSLHDANGRSIEASGVVAEILEECHENYGMEDLI